VRFVTVKTTSIRIDTQLADEAARILGAKSRRAAVHAALQEIVALKRRKKTVKKRMAPDLSVPTGSTSN
jgi:Arc/MetJ family transcription regulator